MARTSVKEKRTAPDFRETVWKEFPRIGPRRTEQFAPAWKSGGPGNLSWKAVSKGIPLPRLKSFSYFSPPLGDDRDRAPLKSFHPAREMAGRNRKRLPETWIPAEPLPGHLLAIPFHDPLQKVRGFVLGLTDFRRKSFVKMINEIKMLSMGKWTVHLT